jgi:dTDP-4-dehydrorhamnose 3,5-epimerase/CDP-3, 6-dideoxy-D-glycero-D-glycero-4-hexulose-5-epimerase
MWPIEELQLEGAKLITLPAFKDARGEFIKTYHDTVLKDADVEFELKESYFSTSAKDVIRGMHFQLPPHDHAKIVFCPNGAILDVIVDLRKSSTTYGLYHAEVLSAENHKAYYIPKGFAHGFKSLTEGAMTYYLVSSEYNKESDTGIRYDSLGYNWQVENPIISDRDLCFPTLQMFDSPF